MEHHTPCENLCEICLLKDKKKRDLILFRIERMAKLEKFLEALARITLLDWGAVADKLKNEISIEAIASGLNIVDRVVWIGAIDSQIHAEMKNEEEARNTIINAENGQ